MLGAEQYRQALAHHFGLGLTDAQAVSHLSNSGGLGQTELASMVGITTGATTALIDRLESAGIGHRTAHPTDRRRTVVTLSEKGVALARDGQQLMDKVFDNLVEEDLGQLVTSLDTLRQNMEDQSRLLNGEGAHVTS